MPSQAFAETVVWDGEVSTNAATPTNWSADTLPSGTGVVVIDSSAVPNQPRVVSAVTWGETNVSAGLLTLAARLTSNISVSGTGTVRVESGGAVTGNITVLDGGVLDVNDFLSSTASITLNGTGQNGTGALRGTNVFSSVNGPITLGSDTRIEAFPGLSINGIISGNGQTLTFGGNGSIGIQSGSIRTGAGSVIKEGTGILGLFGANTYTGDTHVRQGSLQFGFGSALSDTGMLTFDAGTSGSLVGGSETIGALSGSGTLFIQSNDSLTIGDARDTTFSGNIQGIGNGGLIKQGTGTLTLTGNNTYRGSMTINEGTLRIGNVGALSSASDSLGIPSGIRFGGAASATLLFDTTGSVANAISFTGSGLQTIAATTGNTLTISGSFSNPGTGTVRLGSATDNGTIILANSGGTAGRGNRIEIGTRVELSTIAASNVFAAYNQTEILSGGTLVLGAADVFARVLSGAGTITNNGAAARTLTADTRDGVTQISGLLQDGTSPLALRVVGFDGSLTLSGQNTYTGGTTIDSTFYGGVSAPTVLIAQNSGALGSGSVTFTGGLGQLNLDFDGTLANDLVINGNARIAAAIGRAVTLGGEISLVNSTLRFGSATDSGTIVLSLTGASGAGVSNFAVDGGILRFGNPTTSSFLSFANGSGGTFSLAAEATIDINGVEVASLAGVNGSGTIANYGAQRTQLILVNSGNFTGTFDTGDLGILLDGALAGSANLVKTGVGTLELGAGLDTSGHTGGITVAEGTLSLRGNLASTFGAITTTGSVIDYADQVDNAAQIVVNSNTTQLQALLGVAAVQSGVISELGGPRQIEKIGDGFLTLTGTNTYSGGTVITAGTLAISRDENLGAAGGRVTIGNATLDLNNASALTLARDFTLTGGATIRGISSGAITLSGALSGSGSLFTNMASGERLTLTGTNTYAGTTTVNNGLLQIGNGGTTGTLGLGNVTIGAGSLIINRSNDLTIGNTIDGFGSLVKEGAGTLTLTGNNSYTGGTSIVAGTLVANRASAIGTGPLTFSGSSSRFIANFTGTLTQSVGSSSNADVTIAVTAGNTATLRGLSIGRGSTFRFGTATETGTTVLDLTGTAIGSNPSPIISVEGGTLRLSTATAGRPQFVDFLFARIGALDVGAAGTFDVGGVSTRINGLRGSGVLANSGSASTITLTNAGDFTGAINTGTGGITLGGALGVGSSITKTGTGTLTVTDTNTFTGGTSIREGIVQVNASGALGTGFIQLVGGNLRSGADVTLANRIDFATDLVSTISAAAGTTLSLTGRWTTGRNSLTRYGTASDTGTIELSYATGSTSLPARISIDGGTVRLGTTNGANSLAFVGQLVAGGGINVDGTLDLNGFSTSLHQLTGTGTISSSSGAAVLTLSNVFAPSTFGGVIADGVGGPLSLVKSSTGTLTLTGANTFTGGTTLSGGTLIVNGSLASGVNVNGGTLSGTGTIAGGLTINSGGTLAAGNSPGTMTVGALTLNAGSLTSFELSEAGVAGGANNDLIRVTGALTLNGGNIEIVQNSGFSNGRYTLFEFGSLAGALGNLTLNPLSGGFVGTLAVDGNTIILNAAPPEDLIYWNGSTLAPTGAVVGGSGTWNFTNGNFTEDDGDFTGVWAGNGFNVVFAGTGGTVTIDADTTVAPGGLAFLIDGYTITGGNAASRLELTGATGIDTLAGVGAAIDAVISGTGSLTKTGAGTLTLGGANTYTGDTSVLGGTLVNSGTIAGIVRNFATFTSTGTLAGELVNNAGATANLAGTAAALSNSGTLNVTGNLNAAGDLNNFPSGTVTINAGATASITGGVSNEGSAANAFTVNGSLSATGAFQNQSGGNLLIAAGGTLSATGGIFNRGGAVLVNNGTIASSIFTQGSFTSTGTLQAGLELGAISATANLQGTVMGNIINPGRITLTGVTTGIGAVDQGTFGEFNLGGFNTSFGSLAGGGRINLGAGTLTLGGNGTSTTFDGGINGTGGLIKTGAGTFTLRGIHGYTGQTRVDEGTLALAGGSVIAGQVRNDATFTNAGTVSGGVVNLATLTSTGTINGGLSQFAGATATVSGTLNGFVNNAGSITVNGNLASNDFGQITGTGQVQINSGVRWSGLLGFTNLSTNAAGLTIAGTLDVDGILVTQTGATTVIAAGGTLEAVNSANLGTVTNNGTVNADVTNGSGNVAGTITNTGTWNGTLSQGAGSVTNGGTWNGNFLLDAGGTITNNGTWDTTSPFGSSLNNGTFSNNGTLEGLGFFITGASANLNSSGAIALDAGQAFQISSGGTLTNTGTASAIANVNAGGNLRNNAGGRWFGAVNIQATGSAGNAGTITGTVVNAGSFTSTGTVNGALGNLAGGSASLAGALNGAVENSGTITLTGTTTGITGHRQFVGGIFNLAGFDTTIGGLAGVGEVRLGDGDLTVNLTSAGTGFGGVIAGTGDLIKTGAQTLTLSGANSFTGLTTVNAGTLALTGSLAGAVLNNATFTNSGIVAGLVTNSGTLTSNGFLTGGLTNNAGATANLGNTVNGTIANAGTITLTGNLFGRPALTQQASGSFDLAGFNADLGSIAGSGIIALGSGVLFTGGDDSSTTFDGVISGTGALAKLGTGTLTLTGVNTYTGETEVAEGALTLAAGGVIAGRVSNFATFTNAGTVAGIVVNRDTFASTGTVNGGLTQFAGAEATVSGTLNGAINSAGALIIDGNLAGDGILTNSGAGTVQVLSGVSVTGLAGIDNASTAANSFVIAGDVVTSGTVINRAGGTMTVALGASLEAGNMANLGTLTNTGTLTSDVTNSGTIQNDFFWTGNLSQGTGSTTNSVLWTGAFLIDAGGVVTNIGRWDNTTGFLSAVNNGLFENRSGLFGGGVNVIGDEARFANRAGGTVQLGNGQFLRAESGGIISNAGIVTGGGQVSAGGVIQNLAGGTWTGAFSVAATGSLSNAGTLTGNILNFGTFVSTDTVNGMLVNEEGASADLSGNFLGDIANAGSVSLTGITNGIGIVEQSSTGAFDLAGFDTAIGGLSGNGLVLLRDGNLTVRTSAGSTAFLGEISGTGELIKTGSFDLILQGTNTFTGLTTVNQGALVVDNTGSLAGSVRNNARLVNGGTIGGSVTNFGTFVNANRLLGSLTNRGSVQLAGQIDGDVINNGSITNIGGAIVLGRFAQGEESSLDLAGFNSSFGSLAGGGTIALGSAFLTVGTDSTSSVFDGVISGTGGLVKVGAGTFTLNGANTYTGTTFVNAGTLVVGGEGEIVTPPVDQMQPAAAPAQQAAPGSLLSQGERGLTNGRTAATLAAAPEAALVTAQVAPAVTAAPPSNAVIAGNVVNAATLINNGTIGGQVQNNAGASTTNNGVIVGAVFNDGTLVSTGTLDGGLANTGTAQISGVLDGDVVNSGAITLTGTTTGIDTLEQSEEGIFDLAGFETTVGVLSGAGSVTLGDGDLTTGTDGVASLFSGVISGNGSLAVVGAGRLVLTGTNTYAGGTTVGANAILQLGDGGEGGAIIGPVANNGTLLVNRSNATSLASIISGTGMFVQDGTGTTTLTGANTYSGGTLVNRGRLVGNTGSLQGMIQINANGALEFAQASTGTFAGSLMGTGLFDKTGAGMLTLSGNSNGFTGATFVRAGELRVTGGLAGSVVTAQSGTTVSGNGVIGGLIAQSGSTIAPGTGNVGTLGVNGNVTLQTGSTVLFQVSASGPSDAILATGTAGLGGTAAFTNLGGNYAFNTEIVLVQATGGRSGTFDLATGFAGFGVQFRPELIYTATQARLRLAPNLLSNVVGAAPLTANQRSVVTRIDQALLAGYNPASLLPIYVLPNAQIPGALDQLSGEVYATAAGVGIEQERLVREAVLGRLAGVAMAGRDAPEVTTGFGAWGQAFGSWGDGESDGNAAAFDTDRTGFVTGLDYGKASETGSWRLGAFGMRVESTVTIDARGSSAKVKQSGGGVYAGFNAGGFSASLGGYLAGLDLRAFRSIRLTGFADDTVGKTEGTAQQAFGELSYTLDAGTAQIRPFVAGSVGSFKLDALTETGGPAALIMGAQGYDTASVTGGVDASVLFGKKLRLGGMLAARGQLGDRDPSTLMALAAAPQQAFAVSGAQLDDVALAAKLEAVFHAEENLTITLGYSGLIGETQTDHAARATIQVQF